MKTVLAIATILGLCGCGMSEQDIAKARQVHNESSLEEQESERREQARWKELRGIYDRPSTWNEQIADRDAAVYDDPSTPIIPGEKRIRELERLVRELQRDLRQLGHSFRPGVAKPLTYHQPGASK